MSSILGYLRNLSTSAFLQRVRSFRWLALMVVSGMLIALVLRRTPDPQPAHAIHGTAQGTTYRVTFYSAEEPDLAELQAEIDAEFDRIDALMSNYRPDSTIARFNAARVVVPIEVGREIVQLVEVARQVSLGTEGCYDVTVGPLFELWGFRGKEPKPPGQGAIQRVLETTGFEQLRTRDEELAKSTAEVQVDLSSIAQGYSAQRVATVLERHGTENYLVEVGGELMAKGTKPLGEPWRVGIERPWAREPVVAKVLGIRRRTRLAIATSGTYRHFFDSNGHRYSHVLDARTGWPVRHRTVSVTVLMEDGASADAWSTGLLCLGREAGMVVANREHIPALFIEEQHGEPREVASQAWAAQSGVKVEER